MTKSYLFVILSQHCYVVYPLHTIVSRINDIKVVKILVYVYEIMVMIFNI